MGSLPGVVYLKRLSFLRQINITAPERETEREREREIERDRGRDRDTELRCKVDEKVMIKTDTIESCILPQTPNGKGTQTIKTA